MTNDGSRVEIRRTQILRANQPGVTAYYSTHAAQHGYIDTSSISTDVYCSSCHISAELELFGKGALEVLQTFSRPLPYAWYVPLIPLWILNRDYDHLANFLKKTLVKRTMTLTYVNEYNVAHPSMRIFASNYPQVNLSVSFTFPPSHVPANVTARRIKNNAVINMPIDRHAERVEVRIDRLMDEVIKIDWTSTQLPQSPPVAAP